MQTLFFQVANNGEIIGANVQRSNPSDIEIANCPDDVLVFLGNYRVKNGALLSVVSTDYPYPDRPIKVEILESDLVKMLLDANYSYIAKAALESPAVQRNGKVTAWFKNLEITYEYDGETINQSTAETKAILAVQYPNITITINPVTE
jgi:hypothetical protein